jgi:hypothetical protein
LKLAAILVSSVAALCFVGTSHAQEILVPAGTLLQCTLNEPNFSSKTVSVGDPVVCHLKSLQEFDRPAFPRGSMLGGHLESKKDPGHFYGKGYLQITFDRVILPHGDVPVPAKVIAAKGFKVDKQGDIDGKGHAKRDVVEWMVPPLWPWKVVTLPLRGPRPTLKGEEPLELRLMDDIVIPGTLAFGPFKPDRPPSASASPQPSTFGKLQPSTMPPSAIQTGFVAPATAPAKAPSPNAASHPVPRITAIVLKSKQVFYATKYLINGDVLTFEQLDGAKGAVDLSDVDWRKTAEMTGQLGSGELPQDHIH